MIITSPELTKEVMDSLVKSGDIIVVHFHSTLMSDFIKNMAPYVEPEMDRLKNTSWDHRNHVRGNCHISEE